MAARGIAARVGWPPRAVAARGGGWHDRTTVRRPDPHRTGSRRIPPPGGAFARADRRAEYRPDEPGRVLPELPQPLVSRGGRRQGYRPGRPGRARGRLWDAVQGMAGQVPERGDGRAKGGARQAVMLLPRGAHWTSPARCAGEVGA